MIKKALLLALALLNFEVALQGASDVSVLAAPTKGGKFAGRNPKVFKPKKANATAGKGPINKALNGGKGVTLKTASGAVGNGDLIIGTPLAKIKGKSAVLTLEAVRDIKVNGAISSTVNGIPVVFRAGRAVATTAAISHQRADITIDTLEPFTLGASLSAGAGRVLLQSGSLESSAAQTVTAKTIEVSPAALWRLHGTGGG
jgi:hypothetical protein